MNDTGLQCFPRFQVLALGNELQRRFDADQSRQSLRATAARQQSDLHLRQTENRARIVGGNAIVTGKTDFETATERSAVDGCCQRLAAGLQLPQDLVQFPAPTIDFCRVLALVEAVDDADEVRAGHEAVFA